MPTNSPPPTPSRGANEPALDVALIGVPKSGTSALFSALAAHPDIQGTEPKETFYFTDPAFDKPERANFADAGWDGFEQFFSEPRRGRKRLEATTISLFQETALREFTSLDTPPLIVVAVRCPARQIRSHFYYNRSYGRIDASLEFVDYADALLNDDTNLLAVAIPDPVERAIYGASLAWGHYTTWIDRWLEHLAPERLMVVSQGTIAHHPADVLRPICERLGIDPAYDDDYQAPEVNVTHAGVVQEPSLLSRLGRRVLPDGAVRDVAARWDQRRRSGPTLGPPTDGEEQRLNELGRLFKASNDDLAARFGVDTSTWYPHA